MYHNVAVVAFGELSANKISNTLSSISIRHRVLSPYETPKFYPTHIILSGGPKHVYQLDRYNMPDWVINNDIPVLGICYGMQLIAYIFGGDVIRMNEKEEGLVPITEIVGNQQMTYSRCMNRYDQVITLPRNFTLTGITDKGHIAAFTDFKKWWAVQYHPESMKYRDINVFQRFLAIE